MTWYLENTRAVLTKHQHLSRLLSAAVGGAYTLWSRDHLQGSNRMGDNGHPSWRAALGVKLAHAGRVGSPGQQRVGRPGDITELPQRPTARSCKLPPPPPPPQWPSETQPMAQVSRESGLSRCYTSGREVGRRSVRKAQASHPKRDGGSGPSWALDTRTLLPRCPPWLAQHPRRPACFSSGRHIARS